ncbi:glycerophosphodiester phosphodiesterase [Kurthia sibirica]|uniref:Glycerophosphodiester phosphodiesterase n=1 Tax=Kurthia sibirica TaxID=202750 RepID=A0A2U3ALW4_9BACL|nr:glycerophosphodiester phosphodiesterase family protein [Kurthia sibirica]PWI25497.1 glycerophosphodiester phosphodiesterase [Kurthia sibirica]GEK33974.1 hypothetical protein KSI01_15070 [Kurthia sibirica]
MSRRDIFAHRGVTTHAHENTMAAFKAAMATSATGIEFDLQMTLDRVAIVTHDYNMKKTIGKAVLTTEMTLAAIKKKKIAGTKEKILTFDELLAWAIPCNIPMNIELKESFENNIGDLEIIVRKTQSLKNCHFSSFHAEVLQNIKKINAQAIVALIPTRKFDWTALGNMPWLDLIHANKRFYYKERYLQLASNANIGLRFYGITGKEPFLKNPHASVIGWITDYPNAVHKKMCH